MLLGTGMNAGVLSENADRLSSLGVNWMSRGRRLIQELAFPDVWQSLLTAMSGVLYTKSRAGRPEPMYMEAVGTEALSTEEINLLVVAGMVDARVLDQFSRQDVSDLCIACLPQRG